MRKCIAAMLSVMLLSFVFDVVLPVSVCSGPAPALTKVAIIEITSDTDPQGAVPSNTGYVGKRFSGTMLYVKVQFVGTPGATLLKESGTILQCPYDVQTIGNPVAAYVYTYKIPFSQLQANNHLTIQSSSNGRMYSAGADVGIHQ